MACVCVVYLTYITLCADMVQDVVEEQPWLMLSDCLPVNITLKFEYYYHVFDAFRTL